MTKKNKYFDGFIFLLTGLKQVYWQGFVYNTCRGEAECGGEAEREGAERAGVERVGVRVARGFVEAYGGFFTTAFSSPTPPRRFALCNSANQKSALSVDF